MSTNNALNVKFLKGLQASLDNKTSYQAGAFYLTTDTDRLYFAQSENELAYINRYVTTVPEQKDLPAIADVSVGDFYYIATGNILCTKAAEGDTSWTQINPKDTNTDTSVSELGFSSLAKDGNIEVSFTLKQKNKNVVTNQLLADESQPADLKGTFVIKGSDIGTVVTNIALDVAASVESNIATINLTGTGVADDATGFTIAGGSNVTVTSDENNDVIINAVDTKYKLNSAANATSIVLRDAGTNGAIDTISINAGSSNDSISVTGATENEILIAHKPFGAVTSDIAAAQTPANAGSFKALAGITTDNGHVTGLTYTDVTLPDMSYSIKEVSANKEGQLSVTLADSTNQGTAVVSGKDLFYKVGDAVVYNQGDLKDHFYTRDEIAQELKAANAMTFIGSVGGDEALPTEGVRAGDSYIVVGADGIAIDDTRRAEAGDLIIASGDEGADGFLTNIEWIHVPSGDEIDTTYSFQMMDKTGLVIKDHNNVNQATIAFEGDNNVIEVSTDGKVVVTHGNVARTDTTGDQKSMVGSATVDVVTGVSTNAQGHLTGIEVSTLAMPATVTYGLAGNTTEKQVELKDNVNAVAGTIKVTGSDKIAVDMEAAEKGGVFTVSHATATVSDVVAEEATILKAEDVFNVVTDVEFDDYGHAVAVHTTPFKAPVDSQYALSGAILTYADNAVTITDNLIKSNNNSNAGSSAFTLSSQTLTLTANNDTRVVTADLTWGSF